MPFTLLFFFFFLLKSVFIKEEEELITVFQVDPSKVGSISQFAENWSRKFGIIKFPFFQAFLLMGVRIYCFSLIYVTVNRKSEVMDISPTVYEQNTWLINWKYNCQIFLLWPISDAFSDVSIIVIGSVIFKWWKMTCFEKWRWKILKWQIVTSYCMYTYAWSQLQGVIGVNALMKCWKSDPNNWPEQ